jgi:uncharacterized protein involved in propanediol utilization
MTTPHMSAGQARVREVSFERHDTRRVGRAVCYGHHGELFQGQIEDVSGRRRRCLVSLPCVSLRTEVTVEPGLSSGWRIAPAHKAKTLRAVELTAAFLGAPDLGGTIAVSSNIEEGKGYGSSTADCVAAVRATASALGQKLSDEQTADLCVKAETASDNVMFDTVVLFAQREGVALEDYRRPFPALEVIGIDTDPSAFVDTLEYPPAAYEWHHIQMFTTLVGALRRAFASRDVALLGRVATASAIVNDEFLPKPMFAELLAVAAATSILGVAAAHSGTLVSLLLDPADPALPRKVEAVLREVEALGITEVSRFRTAHGGHETRAAL